MSLDTLHNSGNCGFLHPFVSTAMPLVYNDSKQRDEMIALLNRPLRDIERNPAFRRIDVEIELRVFDVLRHD